MTVISQVVQDAGAAIAARVRKLNDGQLIQQADVSSVTYTIRDAKTGEAVQSHENVSVQVANAVYDTLQTGNPLWTVDRVGYNVLVELDAGQNSPFPQRDRRYGVTVELKLTSGQVLAWTVEVDSQRNYVSG